MPRILAAILTVGFALNAPLAQAASCAFTAFKPGALLTEMAQALSDRGAALSPGAAFATDGFVVIKDKLATATVQFEQDRFRGTESVTFTSMDGQLLARLRLDVAVHRDRHGEPVGRDNWIQIWTAIDAADADEVDPFQLIDGPAGIDHYRFNRKMNVTLWRAELSESLSWLAGMLADPANGRAVAQTDDSPSARLEQAFAMHADLIPYLGRLSYHNDRSGYLVVSGVVHSNYIYGLILHVSRAEGLVVRPELVIDSGLPVWRTDLPAPEACSR